MKLTSIAFFLSILVFSIQQEGLGQQRLQSLKQKSLKIGGLIKLTNEDFKQYVLQYPRPYFLVIYFTGLSCKVCDQLKGEYEYMASLFEQQGANNNQKNPVFFGVVTHSRDTQSIFQMFRFKSVPNILVTTPETPLISQLEKKQYLQKYKWSISTSDGDVTTHKMLDFVNPRTNHNIFYKPTIKTVTFMFFAFIIIMAISVFIYNNMRQIWTHWLTWFIGALLVYITCVSGVVYDVIHDVPFIGRDKNSGEMLIFTDGTRQQFGAEGFFISLIISLIGMLFIAIVVISRKLESSFSIRFWGLTILILIFLLINTLESLYKSKSWYGPKFFPPEDYSVGGIATDQGNSI